MTNEEFSNAFDTLLNSYKHRAEFGDQSSIADITVDEYEKSLFLTQAQDNIVKNYFQRTLNSAGDGFDDSTRRQMDYSSLITVKKFSMLGATKGEGFSDGGYTVNFKDSEFVINGKKCYPLFIINERITAGIEPKSGNISFTSASGGYTTPEPIIKITSYYKKPISFVCSVKTVSTTDSTQDVSATARETKTSVNISISFVTKRGSEDNSIIIKDIIDELSLYSNTYNFTIEQIFGDDNDENSVVEEIDTITGVSLASAVGASVNSYVVVPINYKEYDRMMSKAYCEPLKRQAWRLFESNSSDLGRQAEIILRSDASSPYQYIVRYVRRPKPIVLVNLAGTENNLSIDGVQVVTECELNPIIHQEILQEAVRIALASNGIETADMKALRASQK